LALETNEKFEKKLLEELETLNKRISKLERRETVHKKIEERLSTLNSLKEQIIGTTNFVDKLQLITDGVVDIFGADFARIWIIKEGDLCEKGCLHFKGSEGSCFCHNHKQCLHLMVNSGQYIEGDDYKRVPCGCYKIGRIASGDYSKFITNDITQEPQVHIHKSGPEMGLVSFAGYRLLSSDGNPIGVLALSSKHPILSHEEKLLEDMANTASYVIMGGRIEESLRKSEEKFREVFNNTNDALFLLKLTEKQMNEQFIEVNDVACQMLNYSRDELLQMSPRDIDVSDPEEVAEKWEKIVNDNTIIETVHISKNGLKIPVELNTRIFNVSGEKLVLVISRDITERKKADKNIKKQVELLNLTHDAIFVRDQDDRITFWNRGAEQAYGWSQEEALGKIIHDLLQTQFPIPLDQIKAEVLEHGRWEGDLTHVRRDGSPIIVSSRWSIQKDENGEYIGFLEINNDITQRKKAEKKVEESLKEKEMLLKEIHHRVKNNLMVISSLLNLQSQYVKDKEVLGMFKETQSRARSMAIIHERLYQSEDLKTINFGKYIRTLAMELLRTYNISSDLIKLYINVKDVKLDINTAISLGLIINELVSNSMKHAFPDGTNGEINIDFYLKDDVYFLKVSDNGIGFPEDLDFRKTESLGLKLVDTLSRQIDATVKLDRSHGTSFIIKFKEREY
jgi:PAS domain S-box-containing protein